MKLLSKLEAKYVTAAPESYSGKMTGLLQDMMASIKVVVGNLQNVLVFDDTVPFGKAREKLQHALDEAQKFESRKN